jgi:hypothetical protein
MTDAPETICIARITASVCGDVPTQELDALLGEPYVAYTRSDISQARIANLNSALAAASGTIAAMRENSSTDQARIRQLKAALQWVKAAAKKSNDAPMFYRADIALNAKP